MPFGTFLWDGQSKFPWRYFLRGYIRSFQWCTYPLLFYSHNPKEIKCFILLPCTLSSLQMTAWVKSFIMLNIGFFSPQLFNGKQLASYKKPGIITSNCNAVPVISAHITRSHWSFSSKCLLTWHGFFLFPW